MADADRGRASDVRAFPTEARARVLPPGLEDALAEIAALRAYWRYQANPGLGERIADWLEAAVRAQDRAAERGHDAAEDGRG